MIIVKTVFDESVPKALNSYALKKLNWVLWLVVIAFLALGVMEILDENTFVGIIWLVAAVIYYPLVLVLTKKFQKKVNQSMSVMSRETEEVYIFEEEQIEITQTKGMDYKAVVTTKYSYLYQVIEQKDNFILYISKMQAHLIPKDKIVEGSVEELQFIFKERLGKKFINKTKS